MKKKSTGKTPRGKHKNPAGGKQVESSADRNQAAGEPSRNSYAAHFNLPEETDPEYHAKALRILDETISAGPKDIIRAEARKRVGGK